MYFDRFCRMVPAAGLNPVEQTMKCFLQFDSETGLELYNGLFSGRGFLAIRCKSMVG